MVFEFLSTLSPEAQAGLVVIGRNIYGWVRNSLKDGEIQHYEWKQLGATFLKYGLGIAVIMAGGNAVGVSGITAAEAAGLTAAADFGAGYLKERLQGKK